MFHHKLGQEELVGFVLVVVIVAVGGLVVIGLFFRIEGGKQENRSADISRFLDSAFLVTTKCHLTSPLFPANIGELAAACNSDRDENCLEGTNVCSVLNSSIKEIIKSSWAVGQNSTIKGYELEIVMTANRTSSQVSNSVLATNEGKCAGNYLTGEHLQPGERRGTTIVTTLKLCSDS